MGVGDPKWSKFSKKNQIFIFFSRKFFGRKLSNLFLLCNTLRVPKTGKVCHVFDPGAHTGRIEAKDGNIIVTQHLNIERKHQLKAHCAIIWPLLSSTFVREARVKLRERVEKLSQGPSVFIFGKFFFFGMDLTNFRRKNEANFFHFFISYWLALKVWGRNLPISPPISHPISPQASST